MSTLYCANFSCQSANEQGHTVCQTCGTPLVKRYLWAVGDWIKAYKLEELVEERYLLVHPRVFLDTKPAEKPVTPEEIPDKVKLYLKLFPARLHVPQVYGYLPSPDPEMDLDIWLLEYGSLPLDEQGGLRYPELLPTLGEVWLDTSPLQQLVWLWQMSRLWQPLESLGVVSSLLDRSLVRVHGSNVQLLELNIDEHTYHGVKDLTEIWTDLFEQCHPSIKDFCQELLFRLNQGKIPHAEYLAALLEKAIAEVASRYEFDYQVVTATDKGPTRDHNEDYCYPLSTIRVSFPEPDVPETVTNQLEELKPSEPIETKAETDEEVSSPLSPVSPIANLASPEQDVSVAAAIDKESLPPSTTAISTVANSASSEQEVAVVAAIADLPPEGNAPSLMETVAELASDESRTVTEEIPAFIPKLPTPENSDLTPETAYVPPFTDGFVEESSLPEEGDVPTSPSAEKAFIPPPSTQSEESTSTLAIICDGVGGQDGGEIASQVTVNSLSQVINLRLPGGQRSEAQQVLPQLHRCISDVNDRLNYRNDQEKRSERGRMGTTLVMLMSEKHQVYLGNVGDSRCYWITSDSCQQVTVDDDLASREVRLGYIFYREAIQIPRSGALVQAMGLSPSTNLHPALARLFIAENSLFLLCSDGLCDFDRVEQYWTEELLPVLRGDIDLGTGCDRLINLANLKNGHDNVTVALVSVKVAPPQELPKLDYEEIAAQLPEVLPPPVTPVITAAPANARGSLLSSDLSDVGATLLEVFSQPIDFRTGNRNFWIGMGIGVVVWGLLVYLMGRLLTPPAPPEIVPETTLPAPSLSPLPPASPLPSESPLSPVPPSATPPSP